MDEYSMGFFFSGLERDASKCVSNGEAKQKIGDIDREGR
jgi:hypothetical protein